MNNLSFSPKFSPQHDNGERNMCWRVGMPEFDGYYLITTKQGISREALYSSTSKSFSDDGETLETIAYMKLPKPYKPD